MNFSNGQKFLRNTLIVTISEQNYFYEKKIKSINTWCILWIWVFRLRCFFMPSQAWILFDSIDKMSSYYTNVHVYGCKHLIKSNNENMEHFMMFMAVRF